MRISWLLLCFVSGIVGAWIESRFGPILAAVFVVCLIVFVAMGRRR